jgi:hypothetical protein
MKRALLLFIIAELGTIGGAGQAQEAPKLEHRLAGLVPAQVKPETSLLERDLAALTRRMIKRHPVEGARTYTAAQPMQPVSRLRVVMALTHARLRPETLIEYKTNQPELWPADIGQVAAPARFYIGAALAEGWLLTDRPIRPKQIATWGYVSDLLLQMTRQQDVAPEEVEKPADERDPERAIDLKINYTGLVIDTGSLKFDRSMQPRILDEENRVVYPDPKHIPDPDYVLDYGMMDYCAALSDTKRAGKQPLVITALKIHATGKDFIVSNADAERIRQANRKSRFLAKWAVCTAPSETIKTADDSQSKM